MLCLLCILAVYRCILAVLCIQSALHSLFATYVYLTTVKQSFKREMTTVSTAAILLLPLCVFGYVFSIFPLWPHFFLKIYFFPTIFCEILASFPLANSIVKSWLDICCYLATLEKSSQNAIANLLCGAVLFMKWRNAISDVIATHSLSFLSLMSRTILYSLSRLDSFLCQLYSFSCSLVSLLIVDYKAISISDHSLRSFHSHFFLPLHPLVFLTSL